MTAPVATILALLTLGVGFGVWLRWQDARNCAWPRETADDECDIW